MFKSKIILKAMFIVTSMITLYTLSILYFAVPKVENSIKSLEEKRAKEALQSLIVIVNNVHEDLESFRKFAIEEHIT